MGPVLSIAIPTFGRDLVLTHTISTLLELAYAPSEILVADQTPKHDSRTEAMLSDWHTAGKIRWLRLGTPSITRSMNVALREASSELVLFLDDDVVPRGELLEAHTVEHAHDDSVWATVGQVIQPWQRPEDVNAPRRLTGLRVDDDFPFHSTRDMEVQNVMAGNLCVNRLRALSLGGFDENFTGSAYRFETEFARRVCKAGGKIKFLGNAGIDHLRAERGGTRSTGTHLTSADPKHGIGDHYYAHLHANSRLEAEVYCWSRIFREVRTKFHLLHPWWIPVKLVGEFRAYRGGKALAKRKVLDSSHVRLAEAP